MKPYITTLIFGVLAFLSACAEVEPVKAPVGTIDPKNQSTHDLAVSRDGRRLYATNLASGRLSVIDTAHMETIVSIYTGTRAPVPDVGMNPEWLRIYVRES